MSEKNTLMIILAASVIGAIVTCVMAYKLNQASQQLQSGAAGAAGAVKNLFGL
jgi:pyruvoyl-dependent arginine decarboxylase (PvlArgDC)